MRNRSFSILGVLALAAGIAVGQGPANGPRVAGIIESFDGRVLVVKTMEGETVSVTIAPDQKIGKRVKSSAAEIKSTDFIATSAVEDADGKLHSQTLSIFEGSFRGVNEGHGGGGQSKKNPSAPSMTNGTVSTVAAEQRPSMTNGTVSSVSGADSVTLKVHYPGADKELVVPADSRVVRLTPVDGSAFKSGLPVTLTTQKTDHGLVSSGLFVYIDADQKTPRP